MSWTIVRCDDVAPQAWRNGGGITRELLAWPDAADWQVRISVADITADGPFSSFAGIDRWFAVLTGEGVELGPPAVAVRAIDEPLSFSGESAPDCRLIAGPTRDLNLMTRRSDAIGRMRRIPSGRRAQPVFNDISTNANVLTALFSVKGGELIEADQDAFPVPPMSLAWRVAAASLGTVSYLSGFEAALAFEITCHLIAKGSTRL